MNFVDPRFFSSSIVITALLLAGCPGDDAPADTEAATEGSDTATSTSTGPGLDGTTTTPDPTTSTTSGADETSSESTDSAESTSTGEPPLPEGVCVGGNIVGTIGNVLSREGAPIELTCDPNPMPCGGDPVGEWVAETSCGYEAYPNFFEEQCPGSTLAVQILSQVGTFTFEDDGTFVQDFTTEIQLDLALDPMTCFGIDCDTWQMLLEEDAASVNCQSMGATCDCEIVQDPENVVTMGTYEVVKDEITITVDGEVDSFPYCTQGDRFDFWSPIFDFPTVTEIVCTDDRECVGAIGDMYDVAFCALDEEG